MRGQTQPLGHCGLSRGKEGNLRAQLLVAREGLLLFI